MEYQVTNLVDLMESLNEDNFTNNVRSKLQQVQTAYNNLKPNKNPTSSDMGELTKAIEELRLQVSAQRITPDLTPEQQIGTQ